MFHHFSLETISLDDIVDPETESIEVLLLSVESELVDAKEGLIFINRIGNVNIFQHIHV